MPLISPFTTSFGTHVNKDVYIFKMENDGVTAYSECVTDENPFYGPEDNYTAIHMIKKYLIPIVQQLPDPEEFQEKTKFLKGNNMAKAAMEMLLYDYYSKVENEPLYRYLGNSRGYANVGISLGMEDINVTLRKIQEAIDRGYKRIKLKIMKGKEIEILKAVRDHYPDIVLSADANSDYTEKDFDLIQKIDRFDLVYLEQPLYHDDIIYHSKLASLLSTPICLDESITSPEKAKKAFEIGACSVINIKPGRVGGIYNSLNIINTVKENNGHVWIGGMLETGIGRAFNIAMASLSDVDYPGDTSPNDRYFKNDIVKNTFRMEKGEIKPYNNKGIGIEIDEEYLKKYTVEDGEFL
ncbi:MAG: o-succinylbenzoate synthase [Thermoplasmata archaeon]